MTNASTYAQEELQRNPVVIRKGEIPECPVIDKITGKLKYIDLNDGALADLSNYIPLADLYV